MRLSLFVACVWGSGRLGLFDPNFGRVKQSLMDGVYVCIYTYIYIYIGLTRCRATLPREKIAEEPKVNRGGCGNFLNGFGGFKGSSN